MFGLQAAIGALNDIVDAPRDAGRKPGKPIPAGLVAPRLALGIAAVAAVAGLTASAIVGPPVLGVAIAILAIGFAYDLRLKGTAWSWLPFAVGIPLLPVYAWLGAAGSLPDRFTVLLPAAVLAGAALAIGNALVDVERDRSAGVTSIAASFGPRPAWLLSVAALTGVVGLAVASLVGWGRPIPLVLTALGAPVMALAAGAWLSASTAVARRERGWQLEVVGIAVLGGTWLTLAVPR